MGELKRVKLSNCKTYYLDIRLKQLRNVKNPHDFIDLRIFDGIRPNAKVKWTDWEIVCSALESTDNITKF